MGPVIDYSVILNREIIAAAILIIVVDNTTP